MLLREFGQIHWKYIIDYGDEKKGRWAVSPKMKSSKGYKCECDGITIVKTNYYYEGDILDKCPWCGENLTKRQ